MYVRRTVSAVDPMRLQAFWNRLQVPWPRSQRFFTAVLKNNDTPERELERYVRL